MNKKLLCWLLSLVLLLCFPLTAAAANEDSEEVPAGEAVTGQTVTIDSVESFLEFAENCRLDSYSRGLTVLLTADIDLTGIDFDGIPIFCGSFRGNGHRISGLQIKPSGSVQGLFRYLTDTAQVTNLHAEGTVAPGGSRSEVGGIAGSNAGRLENCSFSGSVVGGDYVGGLVGENAVTGIVQNCRTEGSITGKHFAGGIAGENKGVIRNCQNEAQVNTAVQDNAVDISDISIESITGSEAANTTTDIGGIAGGSTGVIRDCVNRANVGYQQMGYNIGGIAGSQSGYTVNCENYGRIHGRKEVGGIVGQMEPATMIEYSIDTLQILEGQLDTLSGLAGSATYNAQSNAAAITSQVTALEDHMEDAREALETLIPDAEDPELPDEDTITAARNTLTESMTGMNTSINSIVNGLRGTVSSLSRDMQAISGQIGAMGQTLKEADENLGGTLTDVSDGDTSEDMTGKVTGCVNCGNVLADLNVGGIVGAMALENELDQEDNLDILGDSSLNFTGQLRSVVTDCENRGTVACKKQNAGGIVGWQSLGLVKGCVNTGELDAAAADYVGGIAGISEGYIRSSSAKSELSGSSYIGGIAGSGSIVTDCRSMTHFCTVTEKMGEVLGQRTEPNTQEEAPVSGNLYLSIGKDWGAIDGISYDGCAQPVSREEFVALEGLSELFKTVKVYFISEEGQIRTVNLAPGGALEPADIPEVPEKAGFLGEWEGLAEADLDFVEFDTIFPAAYTKLTDTLQSVQTRQNGLAVLLVQGQFLTEEPIALEDISGPDQIEAWSFDLPADSHAHTLRYALPEGMEAEDVTLSVMDAVTGNYHPREFTVNGSYIVFAVSEKDVAFSVREAPADYTVVYLAAAGAAVAIGLTVTVVLAKKKKRAVPQEAEQ